MREWTVPTLGQRCRDPVQAPDGSIWWAGMWANLVGRINPQYRRSYGIHPAGKRKAPHRDARPARQYLVHGKQQRHHRQTRSAHGDDHRYKMPDPAAKDPHTAIFDKKGNLWFTLQVSNMVGRLVPATGEIRLVKMPTLDSRPYGIVLSADDSPWVACNGSNCLVKIDPQTMAIQEYKLPDPKTTVRRLDFAKTG